MNEHRQLSGRLGLLLASLLALATSALAQAPAKKPNILVIWGDDIGYWNVSAYNQGMMGYKTPNIDRLAKEGAIFTDYYGQQSCTVPKLFNLRSDPFETADHEGMDYERWRIEHLFLLVPAQQYVGQFLGTFKEFPPRQKVGSFGIDQVLETLQQRSD